MSRNGRAVRLPASLLERLEQVAKASRRTIEAELELVVGTHVDDYEDRTRHVRGTTAIADYRNQTHEARRLQAEEALEANAAALRRRRIEVVRNLSTWKEITAPEQRGRLIADPETNEVWKPCRGVVFPTDQAHPLNEWAPHAFFVQDGEVVALEPFGGRPAVVGQP